MENMVGVGLGFERNRRTVIERTAHGYRAGSERRHNRFDVVLQRFEHRRKRHIFRCLHAQKRQQGPLSADFLRLALPTGKTITQVGLGCQKHRRTLHRLAAARNRTSFGGIGLDIPYRRHETGIDRLASFNRQRIGILLAQRISHQIIPRLEFIFSGRHGFQHRRTALQIIAPAGNAAADFGIYRKVHRILRETGRKRGISAYRERVFGAVGNPSVGGFPSFERIVTVNGLDGDVFSIAIHTAALHTTVCGGFGLYLHLIEFRFKNGFDIHIFIHLDFQNRLLAQGDATLS